MTELMIRPQTREQWLELAVLKLRPLFDEIDVTLPAVRVSVGWPSRGGGGTKKKVIGQCWKASVASDNVSQLFISPVLGSDGRDAVEMIKMLGVLVHELIHAADDCESGHKGAFAKMAKAIGLTGKMTATTVGEELAGRLGYILAELGPYPHAALNPFQMEQQRPKQTTRMLKLECPQDGYIVRTTKKWIEMGLPKCPCGHELEGDIPTDDDGDDD